MIRERNHLDELQIFGEVALLDPVKGHLAPEGAVIEMEQVPLGLTRENKRSLAGSGWRARGVVERCDCRRSKTHAASSSEVLPRTVRPTMKLKPGSEFDRLRFEAAEVAQLQIAQH
jgi:hypothetical protein